MDGGAALGFGAGEGRADALGEDDVGVGRGEDAVHRGDLVGVDAHLALEAEGERGAGGGFEAVGVGEIDPDRVERGLDAGGTRGGDHGGSGVGEFGFGAGPDHVHVEGEVAGAEGNAADARGGREDCVEVLQAAGGFDDWDQVDGVARDGAVAFELGQQPVDGGEGGGGFDLREDDTVEAGVHDCGQVAVAELGVGGVDADVEERVAGALQGGRDERASGWLFGDCHGVFQIEDHGVGIQRQRLVGAARVVAGGEEERAQRGSVVGHGRKSVRCGRIRSRVDSAAPSPASLALRDLPRLRGRCSLTLPLDAPHRMGHFPAIRTWMVLIAECQDAGGFAGHAEAVEADRLCGCGAGSLVA